MKFLYSFFGGWGLIILYGMVTSSFYVPLLLLRVITLVRQKSWYCPALFRSELCVFHFRYFIRHGCQTRGLRAKCGLLSHCMWPGEFPRCMIVSNQFPQFAPVASALHLGARQWSNLQLCCHPIGPTSPNPLILTEGQFWRDLASLQGSNHRYN